MKQNNPKNEYPAISILTEDFLGELSKEGMIITDEVRKYIRQAVSVGFLFGMAYTKTDSALSPESRLNEAGEIIWKTKDSKNESNR